MGMYDNIYCEMELPDGFVYKREFQSKDMGTCSYDVGTRSDFFIRKDGSIEVKFNHNENCDYEENYKFPAKFEFYAYPDGLWYEYIAYVEDDRVVKIFKRPCHDHVREASYKGDSFEFDNKEGIALRRVVRAVMHDNDCDVRGAIQILCDQLGLGDQFD
jgi:hypothetical protein